MEKYNKLYLGGGCFWGVERLFHEIDGIITTSVGYANGNTEIVPNYELVCKTNTGYVETVVITYLNNSETLKAILNLYWKVINPFSYNRQGNDIGSQYRTGIYYLDNEQKLIIEKFINFHQNKTSKKILVEIKSLKNFFIAEEYHQKYLLKNPYGYCHINKKYFKN